MPSYKRDDKKSHAYRGILDYVTYFEAIIHSLIVERNDLN